MKIYLSSWKMELWLNWSCSCSYEQNSCTNPAWLVMLVYSCRTCLCEHFLLIWGDCKTHVALGKGSVFSNKMLCIKCCHLFVLYEFTECKRGIPTAAAVKFSFQDAISCPRKRCYCSACADRYVNTLDLKKPGRNLGLLLFLKLLLMARCQYTRASYKPC